MNNLLELAKKMRWMDCGLDTTLIYQFLRPENQTPLLGSFAKGLFRLFILKDRAICLYASIEERAWCCVNQPPASQHCTCDEDLLIFYQDVSNRAQEQGTVFKHSPYCTIGDYGTFYILELVVACRIPFTEDIEYETNRSIMLFCRKHNIPITEDTENNCLLLFEKEKGQIKLPFADSYPSFDETVKTIEKVPAFKDFPLTVRKTVFTSCIKKKTSISAYSNAFANIFLTYLEKQNFLLASKEECKKALLEDGIGITTRRSSTYESGNRMTVFIYLADRVCAFNKYLKYKVVFKYSCSRPLTYLFLPETLKPLDYFLNKYLQTTPQVGGNYYFDDFFQRFPSYFTGSINSDIAMNVRRKNRNADIEEQRYSQPVASSDVQRASIASFIRTDTITANGNASSSGDWVMRSAP